MLGMFKFLINATLVSGFVFMLTPVFLCWLVHGNIARYYWIVNGPFPFNYLTSPIPEVIVSIFFFLTGFLLASLALLLKMFMKK